MSAFLAFVVGLLWDSIWLRLAWKILAPKFGWVRKKKVPVEKTRYVVVRKRKPARIEDFVKAKRGGL